MPSNSQISDFTPVYTNDDDDSKPSSNSIQMIRNTEVRDSKVTVNSFSVKLQKQLHKKSLTSSVLLQQKIARERQKSNMAKGDQSKIGTNESQMIYQSNTSFNLTNVSQLNVSKQPSVGVPLSVTTVPGIKQKLSQMTKKAVTNPPLSHTSKNTLDHIELKAMQSNPLESDMQIPMFGSMTPISSMKKGRKYTDSSVPEAPS